MRTIKFRAKVKKTRAEISIGKKPDDGTWVVGDMHYYNTGVPHIHYDMVHRVSVDVETVGQHTGLHDKNGKDIYESDIVKCGNFVYQVVYEDKRFASFALRRKEDMFLHYFGEAMEAKDCEVIGNIHDNPELLNQKSNE